MNDHHEASAPPGWFTPAAIAAVLFETYGVYSYLIHVSTDPASLPIDQRDLMLAMPAWMDGAFAIAASVGLAGALLLLLRRRLAAPLLLLSLVAALVQFGAMLVVPELRNLLASDDLLVPFLILLACYGIWHLARQAQRSGWLR